MDRFLAEFIGTTLLVLLGNGVVANVLLQRTKGHQGGWIVIATGWGLAVYVAVVCTERFSDAHLNPAVSVGLAAAGKFAWNLVPGYIAAQMGGAFCGAVLVYAVYAPHYRATPQADDKLATFCTAPAIRSMIHNLFSELLGTFVFVFTVLLSAKPALTMEPGQAPAQLGLGALGALPVGLLVTAIGLSLGGTTGYAINPARDLGPRLAHWMLPIPAKRDSDWSYAWIPVIGPLAGGLVAAWLYQALSPQP